MYGENKVLVLLNAYGVIVLGITYMQMHTFLSPFPIIKCAVNPLIFKDLYHGLKRK